MIKTFYRRITELFPKAFWERYALIYFSLFLLLLIPVTVLTYLKYTQVFGQRERILEKLTYWEEVVRKYPNYPDGYYNAAIFAYVLKDKEKARVYVEKAIKLDSGFKQAKQLSRQLTN